MGQGNPDQDEFQEHMVLKDGDLFGILKLCFNEGNVFKLYIVWLRFMRDCGVLEGMN